MWRELHGHAPRQLPNATFRCGVRHDGRARKIAHQRSDVHDFPRLLGDHRGQYHLRHDEWRSQIGRDDRVPVFLREVDKCAATLDAGVIEQDIDSADFRADGVHGGSNRRAVGHVEDAGRNISALVAQLLRCRFELVASAPVQYDGSAGTSKTLRNGETEAAVGARNQRDFAGEIERLFHEIQSYP